MYKNSDLLPFKNIICIIECLQKFTLQITWLNWIRHMFEWPTYSTVLIKSVRQDTQHSIDTSMISIIWGKWCVNTHCSLFPGTFQSLSDFSWVTYATAGWLFPHLRWKHWPLFWLECAPVKLTVIKVKVEGNTHTHTPGYS